MKKFTAFFVALAILLSLAGVLPAAAATNSLILSGYYGIDREKGLIGQVVPGTSEEDFLSKVLAVGNVSLSNGIRTGSVLTLSNGDAVSDSLSLVVQADCSGDGNFSVTDALMVKSMLLGQQTFTDAQNQAADVSGDGTVSITDFLQMKSNILGLSTFSPRYISGAESCRSEILALGSTLVFGPSDTAAPASEETDPTEETTDETPDTPASVEILGDAVTWEAGTITAVKLGTALVTWGEESLLITVCEEGLKISLPNSTLFIGPGSSTQLQPMLNHPVDASQISYSVSDDSVLQVTQSGYLTALKEGSATVTVTLPNGTTDTQDVTVITLIDSITVGNDYLTLKPGTTKTIAVTTTPAASPEKLIWTSSDTSIATVDDKGVVTGVKYGTVTVTCTSQYGKLVATCKVKVCNLIQVALTYDDGPSSAYTPKVLDMLKKYNVKATFFMVGNRIKTSTTSVKRMAQEGHEIGYHTWGHTYFFNMTQAEIKADFEKFQETVYNTAGVKATVYRAPGGNITDTALKTIPLPHIMWSVDTRDWETRNTEAVKKAVINGLKDGAIILVHDIHATTYYGTMAAIEYIIKNDLDVEFLTVTELLSRKGTAPEAGKTYYKN